MGKWLQYGLLLSIISVNGWASEPYQIELPLAPSITIEIGQKSHALRALGRQRRYCSRPATALARVAAAWVS